MNIAIAADIARLAAIRLRDRWFCVTVAS